MGKIRKGAPRARERERESIHRSLVLRRNHRHIVLFNENATRSDGLETHRVISDIRPRSQCAVNIVRGRKFLKVSAKRVEREREFQTNRGNLEKMLNVEESPGMKINDTIHAAYKTVIREYSDLLSMDLKTFMASETRKNFFLIFFYCKLQ